MKPSRVTAVLTQLLTTRWSPFIWGPPGVGKSSIVHTVARAQHLPIVDIRALLLDPTDLRGIPAVVDGRAVWCPPAFLPTPEQPVGVLFFDELNAAPPLVQASLYQLLLDRRVGDYALPEGWRIVAAGNRAEDLSITFRMPAALANRLVHLDFEIDFDDWRAWAIDTRVHPLVIGFLSTRRELLFDMGAPERAFPTPRSWEMLSDTLHAFGSPRDAEDILVGIIGPGAAAEFIGYCRQSISETAIREILMSPRAKLPSNLGDQYAVIAYAVSLAKDPTIRPAIGPLVERLTPELGVLLVRDVLRSDASFAADSGVRRFLKKHSNLIV